MAKWVHDCPLQHPLDRLWSLHSVLMFLYRTVLGGSGRARAPLHRNVDQLEVGGAALFLASDLSSAITGEVMYVDCGYNIMGF